MKTKKLLSVVMSVVLVSATLVGCSSKKDEAANGTNSNGKLSGSITVLTHRTDMTETFKKYKEKFEKENPGTTINFEAVTDYQNTLSTRMSTGDYGDVLMMPANITKNQFKDFYAPLGTREELNKEFSYLDNFDVDGTVYGLATGANAIGYVYNDKVLKDAGITELPKTPEEYFNDLKLIKEKTQAVPYYTNYVADWSLTPYANANQISISGDVDYMNKMIYNKNEFTKGTATYTSLDLLYEPVKLGLVEKDPMTSDWETSKQMMADGKIGFMCLGSWAVGQMKALSKTPENVKFMPVPVRQNGKATIQIAPDYGMGVNVHSKNIELAKAFVKFFVKEYPNDSNMVSSIKGAKLPDFLSGAKDVQLVEAKPGTTQMGKDLDAVQKEALVSIYDGTWIKKVIEIGLGTNKMSFEQYMNEINTKWAKGVSSLGK